MPSVIFVFFLQSLVPTSERKPTVGNALVGNWQFLPKRK